MKPNTRSRKALTPEQELAKKEKQDRFRALWKQVADMTDEDRAAKFGSLPYVNVEGQPFSHKNMMLLALQGGGTVFGGFRQWIKQGRAVRKGEKARMIWVPTFKSDETAAAPAPQADTTMPDVAGEGSEGGGGTRFIMGSVFDISQTDEITAEQQAAA